MDERTTTSGVGAVSGAGERLPGGPGAPRWVQGLLFAHDPMAVLRRARAAYGPVFTLRLPTLPTFVVVCDPENAIALMVEPPTPRARKDPRDRTGLPLRRLRTQRIVAGHVLPAGTDVLLPLTMTWHPSGP
ncbi:MAG: hypothetical protein F2817_18970 [Actinobacteria bacterium]|nr:hypothetical protein [Actinomycetota bacterium]